MAVSIKNIRDPIPRDVVGGIGTALKIDFNNIQGGILPLLEELGWVTIQRTGKHIDQIREKLPPVEDILSSLGAMWREKGPTAVDEASVASIHELSNRPFAKDALLSELSIDEKEFERTFDYGEQARYFGKFNSLEYNTETIWTPLYWAGKTDSVLAFIQKQSDSQLQTIGDLAAQFKGTPGLPRDMVTTNLPIVDSGIWHGFFPTVQIQNRLGQKHQYIFAATPQFELDPKKDIFEKARMIVACLRHGQYHAEITKIRKPRSILRYLRANALSPHSYADVQYAILVQNGIVRLENADEFYGKSWKVLWVDTPENNMAADIADQLLQGEEVYAATKEDIEASRIFVQGIFNYSSEQRRIRSANQIVAKEEFNKMMELASGGIRR